MGRWHVASDVGGVLAWQAYDLLVANSPAAWLAPPGINKKAEAELETCWGIVRGGLADMQQKEGGLLQADAEKATLHRSVDPILDKRAAEIVGTTRSCSRSTGPSRGSS